MEQRNPSLPELLQDRVPPSLLRGIFPVSEIRVSLHDDHTSVSDVYMSAHTPLLGDNKSRLLLLESKREVGKGVAVLQSAK